jgi:ElaB/YqjD/DUF883 family membrane-anchored ribosome-binding protein
MMHPLAGLDLTLAAKRATPMLRSSYLQNELQTLKGEVSHLLNRTGDKFFDAAKSRADELSDQIKTAVDELGSMLDTEENRIEALIAERPIATTASSFALGVVVGFMLGKH